MDVMGVLGIVLGFICIIVGILLDGTLRDYFDVPSILITIGGTIFATMANYSFSAFKTLTKIIPIALKKDRTDFESSIQTLIRLAYIARKNGVLALESEADSLDDQFLKKGILLVVDGSDPELVKNILQTELTFIEERHEKGQAILNSMAAYAPAFGMAGTLIGLINMLRVLDKPEALGPSMAVALITTFYGVILANLCFTPLAGRLKEKTVIEIMHKEMLVEGILSIQAGENPRVIEEKLKAFLPGSVQGNISVKEKNDRGEE